MPISPTAWCSSLRHAGDVVVRAVGGAFLAEEQFLVGHAAQQHAHVVFDVALGLEQVGPLLVEDEAQRVGARVGLERNLDGLHVGQDLLPVVVGQLAFVLEVHQEVAPFVHGDDAAVALAFLAWCWC